MVAADAVAGKAAPRAFVEFMAAAAAGGPEYTIEMEGRNDRLLHNPLQRSDSGKPRGAEPGAVARGLLIQIQIAPQFRIWW
jgi:hypothetical protein